MKKIYKGILEALDVLVENITNQPERKDITLYYQNLRVQRWDGTYSGDGYWEPREGNLEDVTVDTEYETDNYEVGEAIWDRMTSEEFKELEKICNSNDDDILFNYLVEHAEEYLEDPKWEKRILDYFEDSARYNYEENYEPEEYWPELEDYYER